MWFCSLKPTSDQDMYGDIWKKKSIFFIFCQETKQKKKQALYTKPKTVDNELELYVKAGVNEEINFMIIQQN